MGPRPDFIVFLDLECTGNTEADEIVEVGFSMLETGGMTEVGFYGRVVVPSVAAWDHMMATDVVREMHEKSGLLADLLMLDTPEVIPIATIDQDVELWLDVFLDGDRTHVPYGGSGVSHFDRPFIQRQMPRLNKRLTFWAHDVGNIRRAARLAGRTDWPVNTGTQHRALDDARFHAEEFRHALRILKPIDQRGIE